MAAPQMVARLQASASVLAALAGTKNFQRVSESEREQVLQQLSSHGRVTHEAVVELGPLIKNAGFHQKDKAMLLEKVGELLADGPSYSDAGPEVEVQGDGGKGQNYEAAVFLVPTGVWARLEETCCTDEVFDLYARMGLRRSTEGTMRALGIAVLCVTEGLDATSKIPPAVRSSSLGPLKASYKRFVSELPNPPEYARSLPSTPEAFKQMHPKLFQAAFPNGPEDTKFPIPVRVFKELVHLTKCRVHQQKAAPTQAAASTSSEMGPIIRMLGDEIRSALGAGRRSEDIGLKFLTPPARRPHVSPRALPPIHEAREGREDEGEEPKGPKKALTVSEATAALLADTESGKTKGKRKLKDESEPKTKAKGKAAAKSKAAAKTKAKGPVVSYSDERSRSVFQCRCTGVKGAQFSYEAEKKTKAEKRAKARGPSARMQARGTRRRFGRPSRQKGAQAIASACRELFA